MSDPTPEPCKHTLLDIWGTCKFCERYNIFDDPAQNDLVQRIRQLDKEAQRRWEEQHLTRRKQRQEELRQELEELRCQERKDAC